jgi:hypothetical protein
MTFASTGFIEISYVSGLYVLPVITNPINLTAYFIVYIIH